MKWWRSPVLDRRCRSVRPGTCSTNVFREHCFRSQKYRRTRRRTTTRREPNGRSSRLRWCELCTRLACFRQSGHWPGRPVDTASTASAPEESLTRSTRTAIPGISTSSTVLLATPGNTLPKRSPVPPLTWGFTELQTEPISGSPSAAARLHTALPRLVQYPSQGAPRPGRGGLNAAPGASASAHHRRPEVPNSVMRRRNG